MLGLGALSLCAGTPFLFPSLGASTFLLLSTSRAAVAEPRAVALGHVLGATALGATCARMGLARAVHPPAGATTLIVALGFLPEAWHVALVGASAALLVVEVRLLWRLHGEVPPWSSDARRAQPDEGELRETA